MTPRRLSLGIASTALTILLIVVLVRVGQIDLRVTFQQLRSVTLASLAELVLLTGLHVYLSSQKWRCVDAAFAGPLIRPLPGPCRLPSPALVWHWGRFSLSNSACRSPALWGHTFKEVRSGGGPEELSLSRRSTCLSLYSWPSHPASHACTAGVGLCGLYARLP